MFNKRFAAALLTLGRRRPEMRTYRFASLAAAIVVGGGTLLAASGANAIPVGSHVTFGDIPRTMQIGGNTINTYNAVLPPNLRTAAAGSPPLMTLLIEVDNPNNLQWTMAVNGTTVLNLTHNTGRFGVIQEMIPANLLRVGANTVTVRVVSGQGQLRVSDFALYFQADVAPAP